MESRYIEGWGGSLKKVLILVQRPKHKSTPDPVAAPKNIPFGTIFIEFGDNKKYWTFSGLELAPKKQRKANWRSQLHAQRSKMHSISLGPSEKIPFVQKHKEIAICAIPREKPHFEAFPEAKKANWRSQLHAQRSKMHSIPLGPSEKNSFCAQAQRNRDMCDP